MNRTYRSVWNEALGAWVATSELGGGRRKGGLRATVAVATLLLAAGAAHAQAKFPLPVQITDGTADINPGSMLEVESTNRGALMPRIALKDRATWGLNGDKPVEGMMVYNTTATSGADGLQAGMAIWKGGQWVSVDETPYLHVNSTAPGNSTLANSGATGANSIAIGPAALASQTDALAVGNNATASGGGAIALGSGATAAQAGAVALGKGSQTDAAVGTSSATIYGTTYNFAGTAPNSTVSVGASGAERTVTNVAAGRISTTSTDAINGSQLQATNTALEAVGATANKGWNVTAQGVNSTNVAPGATVDLKNSDGNVVVSKDTTSNDVTFNLAKALKADSITTGNSRLDTNGLAITNGPSVLATGIDAGSKKITNVAPGTISSSSTDAVNGSQLDAVNTTANKGWNVSAQGANSTNVAPGASVDLKNSDGNVVVSKTADSNDVTFNLAKELKADSITTGNSRLDTNGLTIANGPSVLATGINAGSKQITNVAAGTISSSSTDAVNGSQLYAVSAAANAGWNVTAQGANSTNVAPGASVDLKNSDGNIVVSKTTGSNDVTFNLSKNLTADSITTGNSKLDTNGLTIANGPSVLASGIDAGGKKITNVAAGTAGTDAVNLNQLAAAQAAATTHYYSVNSTGGTNQDNLGAAGADAIASGKNASVASTSAGGVAMGLGATVQANAAQGVALGAGSQVTQAGGVALGAGSVASTAAGVAGYVPPTATAEQRAAIGATTSTQAAVSVGDAANGQYRQITGVAAGTGDSDAVNVNQLKAVQGQVMQMDQGAVKYDTNADGSIDHSNVTLGGSNATGPVTVHNVAPGVQGNDAVNVNQLNAVNNNLNSRIDSVNNRIDGVARNAYAGVASAMALQMPGSYVPGKTVMRLGVGAFKGESAVGLSFRRTSENNAWSVTGGVATSRAGVGATVGAEWVFN